MSFIRLQSFSLESAAPQIFRADALISVDPYVDTETGELIDTFRWIARANSSQFSSFYSGTLSGSGLVSDIFSFEARTGYTSLAIEAFNLISGESIEWFSDLQNYALAASGQTIVGFSELQGSLAQDYVYGSNFNDNISVGQNDDVVIAGGGNDIINGGTGADFMYGEAGNDQYFVDTAFDQVLEKAGEGRDTIRSTIPLSLFYNDHVENLTLDGTAAISGVGNVLANILTGNAGSNKLSGLSGNDTLFGSSGNDTLTGGAGRDIMTGGSGADDFDFNSITESGKTSATRDIIKDFMRGLDDIDLSTIDANGSAVAGNAAFKFLAAKGAAFTGAKGQLKWSQINAAGTVSDKTIIEGDINGDRRADFQIELTGLKTLSGGDFIL